MIRRRFPLGVMAAALLVSANMAPATGATYSWNASWGGWVDSRCASSPNFKMVIYGGQYLNGPKARICGYVTDLDDVPRNAPPTTDTFNNVISSIEIEQMTTVDEIRFYVHKDYGNPFGTHYYGEYAGQITPDDAASSFKGISLP